LDQEEFDRLPHSLDLAEAEAGAVNTLPPLK
jgi:hypothetical protein